MLSLKSPEGLMLRGLFLGILGTLLFANLFLSASWAQNKAEPPSPVTPLPGGSENAFQWVYSCPNNIACSFVCPGAGAASHVTKLTIYLRMMPVGDHQSAPALFYDFSTRDLPHSNGFSIGTGLNALSCQINGMVLDYSGSLK
jgi:hypothetical protein